MNTLSNPPDSPMYFIVDDDDDDRLLLEEALQKINPGSLTFMCKNGQDGLDKIRSKKYPRPDVIFADLNMPKLNGRQFLKQLKHDDIFKDIPVIIYSTSYFKTEVDELKKMGAAGFIQKPSDFNVLIINLQNELQLIIKKKKAIAL